jgi:hypothetical protein
MANEKSMGYTYFPLNPGEYRIYEVVDIQYSVQGGVDSSFYYSKEVINDSSINQAGEKVYHMYRYRRNNEKAAWDEEPAHLVVVNKSKTNLVVFEESVPYGKLFHLPDLSKNH